MTQPRQYVHEPVCPACGPARYSTVYRLCVSTHDGITLRRFVCSVCNWQSPVVSEPGLVAVDARRVG